MSSAASALSETDRGDVPPSEKSQKNEPAEQSADEPTFVPLPDPITIPDTDSETRPADGDEPPPPPAEAETTPPKIAYGTDGLPDPVRRMRELILEACRSGDIEALRPLLGSGDDMTQLSFADAAPDPIATLRGFSGDEQGHEIMAILLEVLESGYVHLDEGEPTELYVWPYFFAMPLDGLTGPQRIELFKIMTAGDLEDMRSFGAYIFYRVGITPEGRWLFFVAGD